MDALKGTIATVFIAAGLVILLALLVQAIACSPINVQVQQCSNVVKDSSGFTFTGCAADGHGETDGTLRVNLGDGKKVELPSESFFYRPPASVVADARMN